MNFYPDDYTKRDRVFIGIMALLLAILVSDQTYACSANEKRKAEREAKFFLPGQKVYVTLKKESK